MSHFKYLLPSALAFALAACSGEPADDDKTDTTAKDPTPVAISFSAVDGAGTPFECGKTGLHINSLTDALPGDLRFYVHDVQLEKDGRAIPVELEQDGAWQFENVALLDFEDASAECEFVIFGKTKTAETNTTVRGLPAEAGPYTGVRFTLGVPVALNHTDVADAESPLSSIGMDHGKADGRQFLRFGFYSDTTGATGTNDHNLLMLRSVCGNVTAEGATPESADECDKPNRRTYSLAVDGAFDPATHTVQLDVNALVAGYSALGDTTTDDLSSAGRIDCYGPLHAGDMGATSGAKRCGTFYGPLGLDYATGKPTATQTVFSAR